MKNIIKEFNEYNTKLDLSYKRMGNKELKKNQKILIKKK